MIGHANKVHEGFVGHSCLGRWSNLGAGTITSNLKNTYGPVRLDIAKAPGGWRVEVRDAVGNLLADGDQVTLIKDLDVKGAGQTLKRGTLIKSIRLTDDPQEIDCRYEGIKGLVLRAEFVRKS